MAFNNFDQQHRRRSANTLQRFTSDDIKIANISFYSQDLQIVSYRVDLVKATKEQFNPITVYEHKRSIVPIDFKNITLQKNKQLFTWGIGPYVAHRLFNPDLPFSMETGVEIAAGYEVVLTKNGARKSLLTID